MTDDVTQISGLKFEQRPQGCKNCAFSDPHYVTGEFILNEPVSSDMLVSRHAKFLEFFLEKDLLRSGTAASGKLKRYSAGIVRSWNRKFANPGSGSVCSVYWSLNKLHVLESHLKHTLPSSPGTIPRNFNPPDTFTYFETDCYKS